MKTTLELTIDETLRASPPTVLAGRFGDTPCVVKLANEPWPWCEQDSAFFGGQGLVPPFVPLVWHEASAWSRARPEQLLAHGRSARGAYTVLRRLQGEPLKAGGLDQVDHTLREGARALQVLHRAGVVHRDLRPDHLLAVDDGLAAIDLDLALVGGLGPVGPTGSRRWAAPEQGLQAGSRRSDVFALGRIATWVASEGDPDTLPAGTPHASLIQAMCARDPAHRPASASEVLRALGESGDTPSPEPELHPAVAIWPQARWAEALLVGDLAWQIPRVLDRWDEPDPWLLAAVASRLLLAAAPGRREAWLVLATVCELLAERVPADAARYRAQVAEAVARSGVPRSAPARALSHSPELARPVRDQVMDLCAVSRLTSARRQAEAAGDLPALGLVAWSAGDVTGVQDALMAVVDPDPLAVRLRASVRCHRAPLGATDAELGAALPDALRTGLDRVLRESPESAEGWVARIPGDSGTRARLRYALIAGRSPEALDCARRLAGAGALDATVAACIATWGGEGEEHYADAVAFLAGELPVDPDDAVRRAAQALQASPDGDTLGWQLLLQALVAAGRSDQVRVLLEQATPELRAVLGPLLDASIVAASATASSRLSPDKTSP